MTLVVIHSLHITASSDNKYKYVGSVTFNFNPARFCLYNSVTHSQSQTEYENVNPLTWRLR